MYQIKNNLPHIQIGFFAPFVPAVDHSETPVSFTPGKHLTRRALPSVPSPGPAAGVGAGRGELQADQDGPGPAASDRGEIGAVGGEERRLQRRRAGGQAEQRAEHRGAVESSSTRWREI